MRTSSLLLAATLAFAFAPRANAQVAQVNDTTSTPIEGAGHDYIHQLSETVNPANGSMNLRIQIPMPKGRGITIPFGFAYDSNAANHMTPGIYPNFGSIVWATNLDVLRARRLEHHFSHTAVRRMDAERRNHRWLQQWSASL